MSDKAQLVANKRPRPGGAVLLRACVGAASTAAALCMAAGIWVVGGGSPFLPFVAIFPASLLLVVLWLSSIAMLVSQQDEDNPLAAIDWIWAHVPKYWIGATGLAGLVSWRMFEYARTIPHTTREAVPGDTEAFLGCMIFFFVFSAAIHTGALRARQQRQVSP